MNGSWTAKGQSRVESLAAALFVINIYINQNMGLWVCCSQSYSFNFIRFLFDQCLNILIEWSLMITWMVILGTEPLDLYSFELWYKTLEIRKATQCSGQRHSFACVHSSVIINKQQFECNLITPPNRVTDRYSLQMD